MTATATYIIEQPTQTAMSTKAAGVPTKVAAKAAPPKAAPSKPALVAPKAMPPKPAMGTAAAAAAAAAKMHKRSRSGCFTCRLRRKKCDEGKSQCRACKHLGLKCEYKRPLWWSNNEQRKQHKEAIKEIIKNTKVAEKHSKGEAGVTGGESPPGLTHAAGLPGAVAYADAFHAPRGGSDDESDGSFDFNAPLAPTYADMYNPQVYTPGFDGHGYHAAYPAPYEIDIQTERQMYVDDVPTRKDSSRSTFSSYAPPPAHGALAPLPEDAWVLDDVYPTPDLFDEARDAADDFPFFDFQHPTGPHAAAQPVVQVDEGDRPLLEHFVDNVVRLIFPLFEIHQPGSARAAVILPALETNKCYLHCCLSIAAIHLRSALPLGESNEQLDADIVRHRYATIAELCEALSRDTDHLQILEATLGMIFFQCSVGRPDDALPDIPWHQHFQAATSLVRRLDLPALMQQQVAQAAVPAHPPFNMTLTAWIDILGSTMLGAAPQFANHYREMNLSNGTSGLAELMGCEDRTMYLISEIACLEALKLTQALDDTNLCSHIALLAQQIDATEVPLHALESAVHPTTGAVRPAHLTRNLTALYQRAARIWLLSLIPGARRRNSAMLSLQQHFAEVLAMVPTGPGGFDRSIVWPLLMAGAQSTPQGPFRAALRDRIATMGDAPADTGSFGRVHRVLAECWAQEAAGRAAGHDDDGVSWREVMRIQGWDFLLL